jgi:putative FmdB family regulatory protein
MTLYTYHCDNCGTFEEFRENNDREYCECGRKVRKSFGSAFKLYGTGFYSTDTQIENCIKK